MSIALLTVILAVLFYQLLQALDSRKGKGLKAGAPTAFERLWDVKPLSSALEKQAPTPTCCPDATGGEMVLLPDRDAWVCVGCDKIITVSEVEADWAAVPLVSLGEAGAEIAVACGCGARREKKPTPRPKAKR